MYRAFDRLGIGIISFSDFNFALEHQGLKLDKETAVQLFGYLDRDNRGCLSYRELACFCQDAQAGILSGEPTPNDQEVKRATNAQHR